MFQVVEGRRRRRVLSPTTLAASVAAHVLLLGGAVYAAATEPEPREVRGPDIVLPPLPEAPALERDEAPDPPPPPVQPRDQPSEAPVQGTNVVFEAPRDVPTTLPPPELSGPPVDPSHSLGIGRDADVYGPATGDPRPATGDTGSGPPEAFIPGPEDVEELPALDRDGLARALERYYPAALRRAGVPGRVVVEVIVDEDGRVRPGSARILESTHAGFERATLQAVERFRFRPGRMAGIAVPVRVTIPIRWTPVH